MILNCDILLSSSSAGTSPNESVLAGSYGSTPQSLPTFQHPSHSLLKENNFKQEVYSKYYSRCLKGTMYGLILYRKRVRVSSEF
jgi:hypothetical protein